MPLLRNSVQKPATETPANSTGGKKLTLKERLALKSAQAKEDDTIPMDDEPASEPDVKVVKEPTPKKVLAPAKTDDGLPSEPSSQIVAMTSLAWLAIAPPGFGKTEFFSLFPDSLMLACEGGHKFVTGFKLLIDQWASDRKGDQFVDEDKNIHISFIEAIRRLENTDRFKFVFIDTLDALIKKCIDHHVAKANQAHLADLGDYGKGFDLGQNDPIRKGINEILSTGRGLGLITHQQINTNTFSKGAKSKKETSLPNGIHKIVFPQMDIVIHGEYGGIRDSNKFRDRIFRSVGNEDLLAKNRGGILPPAFISPYDKEARAEQMQSFFNPDTAAREKAVAAAYAEYVEFYGEVE